MKRLLAACSLALLTLVASCRQDLLQHLEASASAPDVLAFGEVRIGDKVVLPLPVTNSSAVPVEVVGALLAAPFTASNVPVTIQSGSFGALQITFEPTVAQDFDVPLTVQLSSADTPALTVRLTGKGAAAVGCASSLACTPTQGCCGAICVDTQSDPAHCGGCSPCAAGQSCAGGRCVTAAPPACDDLTAPCGTGQKCCNHACKDVSASGGLCPCTGTGGTTTFGSGTIIIPMDVCWQRGADVTSTPAYCSPRNVKARGDDSPLKAYGLVFFLLRHQVTVYMAIDPAKSRVDGVDMALTSFSGSAPVLRYDWATGGAVPLLDDSDYQVEYRGGPFLIDSSQHDRVVKLLATDPDFAQFRAAGNITVHVAKEQFSSGVAKSISAVPSRIALLVPASDTSTTDILVRYLTSAGLNFPGAGGTPDAPGQIYDRLQEPDFLPDYARSNLKAKGYKLLWSPHWSGGTGNTPAQLATIGAYVNAGGDLFAECAAIGTLEGMAGGGFGGAQSGSPATRFMTSSGMDGNTLGANGNNPLTGPFINGGLTSPFAQRGDFPFAGFTGAIADFHPNAAAQSSYRADVTRYISAKDLTGRQSDLLTSADQHAAGKGTVVYLAGHDYSYGRPTGDKPGVTAGSRLVLNTLFSLGTNNVCQP